MTQEVKHAVTSAGDIAYVDHGRGPPALFVHGVFLNGFLWRHVIDLVADARRCIAVDLLAHGGTRIAANQDISFDGQAEMLEAVCQTLELGRVDVVANDSGGGICQIFAARHPERIRSLTLTNCDVHDNWPPASLDPLMKAVANGRLGDIGRGLLADVAFARKFFGVGLEHPERIPEETFRTYLEPLFANAEATRQLERFFGSLDCRQTVAVEPLLRRLDAPTLIVWGTDDIFFPVKWAYWLRDTIPGCRKVVELDGARLFFPEERPDELARALREFWQVDRSAPAVSTRLSEVG
jgi:pimeloyl-ACP methyl ester carboxylesterase